MSVAAEYRMWNFEDFCLLIPDGQKADLIDGVIYVASPDNLRNADLSSWLSRVLHRYLKARRIGGRVYGTRVAFRLDDENAPEPDLGYVSPEHLPTLRPGHVAGPPDLAAEIVSPDSVRRDYEDKREMYERFGVPEYWIIDPFQERVTCYRLGRDGKYKQARLRKGVVTSKVIPGFWLRADWLWQSPLPDDDEVLSEILASSGNGK